MFCCYPTSVIQTKSSLSHRDLPVEMCIVPRQVPRCQQGVVMRELSGCRMVALHRTGVNNRLENISEREGKLGTGRFADQ